MAREVWVDKTYNKPFWVVELDETVPYYRVWTRDYERVYDLAHSGRVTIAAKIDFFKHWWESSNNVRRAKCARVEVKKMRS